MGDITSMTWRNSRAKIHDGMKIQFHEDSEELVRQRGSIPPVDKGCIIPAKRIVLHNPKMAMESRFEKSQMWKNHKFPTGLLAALALISSYPASSTARGK